MLCTHNRFSSNKYKSLSTCSTKVNENQFEQKYKKTAFAFSQNEKITGGTDVWD